MNPFHFDILETASNLADPPESGPVSAWLFGVGGALIMVICGAGVMITGHAWFLNIGIRGLRGAQGGLFCELFGRQATAFGLVLITLGSFANIHWFWPRSEWLGRFAQVAKAASLACIIAAAGWWIYESM